MSMPVFTHAESEFEPLGSLDNSAEKAADRAAAIATLDDPGVEAIYFPETR